MTEVVQTVRDPKSIIRAVNDDTASKHEEFDFVLPKSVETGSTSTPGRQTSPLIFNGDISRVSSSQDRSKSSRKSGRISFRRYFLSFNFIQNSALVLNVS